MYKVADAVRESEDNLTNSVKLLPSKHDKSTLSFEQILVDSVASRLEWKGGKDPGNAQLVARELIAIAIVLFGFQAINRRSKNPFESLSLRLAAVLCVEGHQYFSKVAQPQVEILDIGKSVNNLTGANWNDHRSFHTLTAALRTLYSLLQGNGKGVLNCALPYLQIGDLIVSSRFEIESFQDIKERVETYKYSPGGAPLNLGVFGPAGSGKSFGVKEIFNEAFGKNKEFHEFNLSGNVRPEDLGDLFLRLQDSAMKGLMPIAFWDEFDSECDIPLGWLKHFLGPMQDGTFIHKGYAKTLPRKAIFVFAGSMFSSFGEMAALDSVRTGTTSSLFDIKGDEFSSKADDIFKVACSFSPEQFRNAKGPDFKSRLDAVLDIRGVSPRKPKEVKISLLEGEDKEKIHETWHVDLYAPDSDVSRLFRKARILQFQLVRRYKQLKPDKGHLLISPETLSSLLFEDNYYHDARSIEKMVKMFGLQTRDAIDDTVVPTGTQRRIHMPIEAFD